MQEKEKGESNCSINERQSDGKETETNGIRIRKTKETPGHGEQNQDYRFTTIKMNVDCAMAGAFCTKPLCWKVFVAKVSNNSLSFFFSLFFSHSSPISANNLVLILLPVVVVDLHEMKKIQRKKNDMFKKHQRDISMPKCGRR